MPPVAAPVIVSVLPRSIVVSLTVDLFVIASLTSTVNVFVSELIFSSVLPLSSAFTVTVYVPVFWGVKL